jgi:hypothetical protein
MTNHYELGDILQNNEGVFMVSGLPNTREDVYHELVNLKTGEVWEKGELPSNFDSTINKHNYKLLGNSKELLKIKDINNLELKIYINAFDEDKKTLVDIKDKRALLSGSCKHGDIDVLIEGYRYGLNDVNIPFNIDEEIIDQNHELFSEPCGFTTD